MNGDDRPRRTPMRATLLSMLAVLTLTAGCTSTNPQPPGTLYAELGGESGVAGLVDQMLREIAGDPRVAESFARSNLSRLRRLLEEQFCEISDGPCEYSGFSMQESHRGMNVTETEFNAVVECLIDAMETERIPTATQNRLLARVAPLHGDVVYR